MSAPAAPAPVAVSRDGAYPAGLMAVLATVTMLFAAFTAALLVRRTAPDWIPVDLPRLVWINAIVIIASSVALEAARQAARRGIVMLASARLLVALSLGVVFLVGQVLAWRALAQRGVFLPTTPHAAFFYLLSAVHGAHVLGGLGALAWALRRLSTTGVTLTRAALTHVALFWHFVGALWLYLLVVLTIL